MPQLSLSWWITKLLISWPWLKYKFMWSEAWCHVFSDWETACLLPCVFFRALDQKDDGCVVDMHHFSSGAQSILAYATVNGALVGWDLRSSSNAWALKHDLKSGLITSFAVDTHQCWLCLGERTSTHCLALKYRWCLELLLTKAFSFFFTGSFFPSPF